MNRITSITIAIAALLLSSNTIAGNNNGPDYGDTTNNNYNQGGTANAGAAAGAVAGAAAGAISGSYSGGGNASVGDIRNTNTNANTAFGGAGGDGGTGIGVGIGGKGGDANQAQGQQQGQAQSSRNDINTSTQQSQSSQSFNAGNAQNVGGQSTNVKFEDVANAPPVILSSITPTMSCAGGFSLGGSSQDGAGALGFTWTSRDCKTVVAGRDMSAIGQKAAACEIFLSTDGYRRAEKIAKKAGRTIAIDCSKSK